MGQDHLNWSNNNLHSITNQEDARKESIEAETEPRDPETVDKLVRVEHAVKKAVDKCTEILDKLRVQSTINIQD